MAIWSINLGLLCPASEHGGLLAAASNSEAIFESNQDAKHLVDTRDFEKTFKNVRLVVTLGDIMDA